MRNFTQRFPRTPILILPSSYFWGDSDLAGCFRGRTAPTFLFARERESAGRLESAGLPENVKCLIDHDMAFRLQDSEIVRAASRMPSKGYLLIVERFDEENVSSPAINGSRLRELARLMPHPLQRLGRQVVDFSRQRNSQVSAGPLDLAAQIRPEIKTLPIVYNDVSNIARNTFHDFVRLIAEAEAVITTRLHAGILAAMLGKSTFLVGKPGGYRKLHSVYEYSLAGYKNVHLIQV